MKETRETAIIPVTQATQALIPHPTARLVENA